MYNFTFLTCEELFDTKLSVIKTRGTKAAITDFSILLGGDYSNDFFVNDSKELRDRTGYYWTKTDDNDNDVRIV